VLLDITNPEPTTQMELARLPPFDRPQVRKLPSSVTTTRLTITKLTQSTLTNHRRVLLDITNPEPKTQMELAGLPPFDRPQVRRLPSSVTTTRLTITNLTQTKLTNHRRVLLDITNPEPKTQMELARLPPFDRPQVRRLLFSLQGQNRTHYN
jgi:hypothetical protein